MAVLISGLAELMKDPGGLWEILILKVFGFISNYGWRIVFFTVCLKLLLFPLDLYQRIKMRKNQMITERIKPQMEKLEEQYANDRKTLSQKQMELNRREGFSYFSSCLPMIVTLVVFFYLFTGLNNISRYKNLKQYVELYDAYTKVETVEKNTSYDITVGDESRNTSWQMLSDALDELRASYPDESKYKNQDGTWPEGGEADYAAAVKAWNDAHGADQQNLNIAMNQLYADHIRPKAQDAVVEKYTGTGEYKGDPAMESFLWIKNIWSPDVPWKKSILTHSSFITNISKYKSYSQAVKKLGFEVGQAEFDTLISAETYNNVMGALMNSKHNAANGYLVLPIVSVALSFLSQFITTRLQKRSGQVTSANNGSMKMMMIALPLMMGFFALQYTAMFTLYIVVNSATTILINVITSLCMEGKKKTKEKKEKTEVQKYGRPDPKDL